MAFQAENDADLIAMTLHYLGPYKWVDLVSSLQDHVAANELIRKEKIGFDSGTSIDFNAQVNPQGSFRMVAIGAPDQHTYTALMTKGNVPWRGSNANMAIPSEVIAMNRESAKIVDIVEEQRAGVYISCAEGFETQFWSQPTGSTDDLNAYGIPYWIVPSTLQGFNGGNPNPGGWTSGAAGLNAGQLQTGGTLSGGTGTLYPNSANYTDSYVEVSKNDAILKMRRAAYFTKFKSPVGANVPSYSLGDRRMILTTNFVILEFGSRAEEQNDNLGNDIASKDGDVVFRRNPVVWVPKLDQLSNATAFSNSTYASAGMFPKNPIYFVNFGWFRPVFLKGWWMKQTGPQPLWGINHTIISTQYDWRWNLICRNRREQAVLTM
jgi:hypothetical protein